MTKKLTLKQIFWDNLTMWFNHIEKKYFYEIITRHFNEHSSQWKVLWVDPLKMTFKETFNSEIYDQNFVKFIEIVNHLLPGFLLPFS